MSGGGLGDLPNSSAEERHSLNSNEYTGNHHVCGWLVFLYSFLKKKVFSLSHFVGWLCHDRVSDLEVFLEGGLFEHCCALLPEVSKHLKSFLSIDRLTIVLTPL